jgi:anaerobic selenocysteine-containing dehydrogenase
MYHVGRPGEDGYTNRCIAAWGVDGHNSHTNICSAGARLGYALWGGFDRPSPDHSRSKTILLVSSHLEAGHYFNPHAQRIIEAKMNGARIITMDPRLSNTASKSDVWLPTWPGSESTVLLSIANHLLQNNLYDRSFVKNWVNWREFLSNSGLIENSINSFEAFENALKEIYGEFTFERAAAEAQVPIERIEKAAEYVAQAGSRLATHTWRSASIGNLGGWQVSRCLFFLNVLTGSIGTPGGTSANSWNKFVPTPFNTPEKNSAWNDLLFPLEWPFSHYEMSFLLPHMLKEGRGDIDVYFTRVYNPLWINPDGFVWLDALKDESKIKCHVALTPTWNESAWYADYVLPMGHAGERHDLLSQETHSGQWVAFRQPVRRVALERAGKPVQFTYEANPGQVWEENEFWTQLSVSMDPDGKLGIRKHFESPYREGEIITVEEYYRWIFENSIPGLPETAEKAGLSPLQYMRKYGVFEISKEVTPPYISPLEASQLEHTKTGEDGRITRDGKLVGIDIDGTPYQGFPTPSGRLEFFSNTLKAWGWDKKQFTIPWSLESHVHPKNIDRDNGEMILLPNFRLPTLIHTRSANAKWLYEISHKNPLWMHPEDAERLHLNQNDLVRV